MRIFPMPKIEFKTDSGVILGANRRVELPFNRSVITGRDDWVCLKVSFYTRDDLYTETIWYKDLGKKIETFEQAVVAWVESWVKANFEGVLVPDACGFESEDYKEKLLILNPNCIVEG